MEQRKPISPIWYVIIDIAAVLVLLVVFAYFHHVFPRRLGRDTEEVVTEASLGDFSAVFPTAPCNENAFRSYSDDNIRIEVTRSEAANLCYHVADVWVRSMASMRTAFASGDFSGGTANFKPFGEVADVNGAILAINGDISCRKESGVVIRNGTVYRENGSLEDVCILYADGTMETVSGEDFDLEAARARGAYQTFTFGPTLLKNGEIPTDYNCAKGLLKRAPRAAIGYYEPGHYCLVVVDGRQDGHSKGLSMEGMSRLFYQLGCSEAYNLDGGASAAMIFRGELISSPSAERTVSEILYVK